MLEQYDAQPLRTTRDVFGAGVPGGPRWWRIISLQHLRLRKFSCASVSGFMFDSCTAGAKPPHTPAGPQWWRIIQTQHR